MLQAYRFALDPTARQARALSSHCGAARTAFNEGLARVRRCLDQRAAERSYGVPEDQLTEVPWTLPALRRWWNQAKDQLATWWPENSKEAYNSGLDALARGLRQYSGSRAGTRRGPRVGFPRFKSRRRARVSCRFTTGAIRAEDRTHVIVVEDLNVTGMSRRKPGAGRGGRGLNRAIADAAPAGLRRQLAYKTAWYGSRLVLAGRWYPSSKTCSACGAVKAKLALAERTWTCDGCGARHDRDVNAAINLARLSEHAPSVKGRPAGSGPVAGRGASRKTSPPPGAAAGGDEASTPHDGTPAAGQTGTAPPQGEAA